MRNGAVTTGYVNGVAVGSNGMAPGFSNNVQIGRYAGAPAFYMTGYMDELRITSGVARYSGNFTVPSSAYLNQ